MDYLGLINGLSGISDDPETPSTGDSFGFDFFSNNGLFEANNIDSYRGGFGSPSTFNLNSDHNNNGNTFAGSVPHQQYQTQNPANSNTTNHNSEPLPSFPEAFGQPANYSVLNPLSSVDFNPPYRDFFLDAPPPTPQNLPNYYDNTTLGAFCSTWQHPPMPDHNQTFFQQSGDAFTGDAFTNFGRGHGASASASACPFAPLRHNQGAANANANANPMVNAHHNHNSNLNPISTPSSLPQPSPYLVSAPLFQRSIATPARPSCGRDPNSDNFLSALASGDFSSPSLPPLNSSPRHPPPSSQLPSPNRFTLLPLQIHDNMPPTRGSASVSRTAASTRARRWSRSSVASTIDLTSPKSENTDALSGIDPATPMAPPSVRKRTRTTATGMSSAPRRRQSSTAKSRPVKPLRSLRKATAFDDDAFDSSSVIGKEEDDDVLDLTGADEVPAELLKPKVDNRIKLAKFQCVICMDEVSNLTVTHCGHLFCSVCLHSALHIDSTKKTCPVCRTKVDVKAKPGQKPSKNTFYHLELKLMTANRKGKLPARR